MNRPIIDGIAALAAPGSVAPESSTLVGSGPAGDTCQTMPEVTEHTISCPYCGEAISILVDNTVPEQSYVEDCQVCCRPIVMHVSADPDGDVVVAARAENE